MAGKKGKKVAGAIGAPTGTFDDTNWREQIRNPTLVKFTDEMKAKWLEFFAETDRKTHACRAVGISYVAFRWHEKNDPEFAEQIQDARAAYRDKIMDHAHTLMMEGIKNPIIGGKERDEVVGEKIEIPVNLLAMEMRRTEPEFKDRAEVDVKGGGGVLVVPATSTEADWKKMVEGHNKGVVQPDPPED